MATKPGLERCLPKLPNEVDAIALAHWSEKTWVWVKDKKAGYVEAYVVDDSAPNAIIVLCSKTGEQRTVSASDIEKMNPPKFDRLEDMAELTHLNEAAVIHNLRTRFMSSLFCVTINPYKQIPIYSEEIRQMYKGKRRVEMAPHVFSVADQAFMDMQQTNENHSILVTGESGAGKTENTKKIIQYLAAASSGNRGFGTLEQQILQSNPVLEAFGNAQTKRNNNSSRFGKFVRIEFGGALQITGASIEHYLLEKSRVTHQNPKERNYHVFYQLLKGGSVDLKKNLHLEGGAADYRYTKNSNKEILGVDDKLEFKSLQESLAVMNFGEEDQFSLFLIISLILHLGNISLESKNDDQAVFASGSSKVVDVLCKLLGVPIVGFTECLLRPKVRAGKDFVTQAKNVDQVYYIIDSLARFIYERLFGDLIEKINQTIKTRSDKSTFIGVLDIAGFEIFAVNGFEQLCINYTNERLQQFFNHNMFISVQEEYKLEKIIWSFIDFGLDLQPTIDLIEKNTPIGILALLDEECVMPKATDKSFVDKLNGIWKGKSSKYEMPRFNGGFIIHHYAANVEYTVTGWLEKNKDPYNEGLANLLATSTVHIVAAMFINSDEIEEPIRPAKLQRNIMKKGAFRTVSQKHREGVNNLMSVLNETKPHFIRCIIPNEDKKPGVIDVNLVLDQLRCNGVLEGLRICCLGYPNRITFPEFVGRYKMLLARVPKSDDRTLALQILKDINMETSRYQMGQTKVFFKAGTIADLETCRDIKITSFVVTIQSRYRGLLQRRKYHSLLETVTESKIRKIREAEEVALKETRRVENEKKKIAEQKAKEAEKEALAAQRAKESLEKLENERNQLLLRKIKEAELRARQEIEALYENKIRLQSEKELMEGNLLRESRDRIESERIRLEKLLLGKQAEVKKLAEATSQRENILNSKLRDAENALDSTKRNCAILVSYKSETEEMLTTLGHDKSSLLSKLSARENDVQYEKSIVNQYMEKEQRLREEIMDTTARAQIREKDLLSKLNDNNVNIEFLNRKLQSTTVEKVAVEYSLAETAKSKNEIICQLDSTNGELLYAKQQFQNISMREKQLGLELTEANLRGQQRDKELNITINDLSHRLENTSRRFSVINAGKTTAELMIEELTDNLDYARVKENELLSKLKDQEANSNLLSKKIQIISSDKYAVEQNLAETTKSKNEVLLKLDTITENLDRAQLKANELLSKLKDQDANSELLTKKIQIIYADKNAVEQNLAETTKSKNEVLLKLDAITENLDRAQLKENELLLKLKDQDANSELLSKKIQIISADKTAIEKNLAETTKSKNEVLLKLNHLTETLDHAQLKANELVVKLKDQEANCDLLFKKNQIISADKTAVEQNLAETTKSKNEVLFKLDAITEDLDRAQLKENELLLKLRVQDANSELLSKKIQIISTDKSAVEHSLAEAKKSKNDFVLMLDSINAELDYEKKQLQKISMKDKQLEEELSEAYLLAHQREKEFNIKIKDLTHSLENTSRRFSIINAGKTTAEQVIDNLEASNRNHILINGQKDDELLVEKKKVREMAILEQRSSNELNEALVRGQLREKHFGEILKEISASLSDANLYNQLLNSDKPNSELELCHGNIFKAWSVEISRTDMAQDGQRQSDLEARLQFELSKIKTLNADKVINQANLNSCLKDSEIQDTDRLIIVKRELFLKESLSNIDLQLFLANREKKSLETRLSSLEFEVVLRKNNRVTIETLRSEFDAFIKNSELQNLSLKDSSIKIAADTLHMQNLSDQLNAMGIFVSELQADVENRNRECLVLKEKYLQLTIVIDTKNRENEQQSEVLSSRDLEIDRLNDFLKKQGADKSKYDGQRRELAAKLDNTRKLYEATSSEGTNLKSIQSAIEAERDALRETIVLKDEEIIKLYTEIESGLADIMLYEQRQIAARDTFDDNIGHMTAELSEAKSKLEELTCSCMEDRSKFDFLLRSKENEIEMQEKSLADERVAYLNLLDAKKNIEAEVIVLKMVSSTTSKDIEDLKLFNTRKQSEINHLIETRELTLEKEEASKRELKLESVRGLENLVKRQNEDNFSLQSNNLLLGKQIEILRQDIKSRVRPPLRVGIIGAGVSGLCLALALKNLNSQSKDPIFDVHIFDQVESFDRSEKPHYILWKHGIEAMVELGLAPYLGFCGGPLLNLISTDSETGEVMVKWPAESEAEPTNDISNEIPPMYNIFNTRMATRRSELIHVLISALSGKHNVGNMLDVGDDGWFERDEYEKFLPKLHMGHSLSHLKLSGHSGIINSNFENGTEIVLDMLVGADGANSKVRNFMMNGRSPAIYAGSLVLQGVTTMQHKLQVAQSVSTTSKQSLDYTQLTRFCPEGSTSSYVGKGVSIGITNMGNGKLGWTILVAQASPNQYRDEVFANRKARTAPKPDIHSLKQSGTTLRSSPSFKNKGRTQGNIPDNSTSSPVNLASDNSGNVTDESKSIKTEAKIELTSVEILEMACAFIEKIAKIPYQVLFILGASDLESLICSENQDLGTDPPHYVLPNFHPGRVILIGDAAHPLPTSFHGSSGASLAMCDSVVLAKLMGFAASKEGPRHIFSQSGPADNMDVDDYGVYLQYVAKKYEEARYEICTKQMQEAKSTVLWARQPTGLYKTFSMFNGAYSWTRRTFKDMQESGAAIMASDSVVKWPVLSNAKDSLRMRSD